MGEVSEFGSTPRHEAAFFFRMMLRGEKIEELRATIAPSKDADGLMAQYRRDVLALFDSFVRAGKILSRDESPASQVSFRSTRPRRRYVKHNRAAIVAAIQRGAQRAEIAERFNCNA
jgi:hypothetical protein